MLKEVAYHMLVLEKFLISIFNSSIKIDCIELNPHIIFSKMKNIS